MKDRSTFFLKSFVIMTLCLALFVALIYVNSISKGARLNTDGANKVKKIVAGKIPAKFSINNNGGASYNIPISLPPGINGLEPKLNVGYNSQSGNGLLGMGFGLAGLSTITRCKAILATDGFTGGVLYDSNDRFCINGERLIKIRGKGHYGASGSIYHTERESWQKVVATGNCGSGPCYFIVTNKKGMVMRYGYRTDSRILARGLEEVRVWAIDSLADLNGNYILFNYEQPGGTGQYYPSEISYTLNHRTEANRFVKFTYEGRPDTMLHYQGGAGILTDRRMTGISTFLGTDLVTSYEWDYEQQASVTGRSRISRIRQCDRDATCKTPTQFNWQLKNNLFDNRSTVSIDQVATPFTKENNTTFERPTTFADVNGDGRMDIVVFVENLGVYAALSSQAPGHQYEEFAFWNSQFAFGVWDARLLSDVNGDGLADIVGFQASNSTISVGISDGTKFGFTHDVLNGFGSGTLDFLQMAEINGDGLADIVAFFSDSVKVAISTNKFKPGEKGFILDPQYSSIEFSANNGWRNLPRVVTDVNGDGRTDIVGFGTNGVRVGVNTGAQFDMSQWNNDVSFYRGVAGENAYKPVYTLSDVNGDALTDIVSIDEINNSITVSISTGKSFLPQVPWANAPGKPIVPLRIRQLADVNGDQLADVISFTSGTNAVAFNTSDGVNEFKSYGAQYRSDFQTLPLMVMADVDGNGLTDIINFQTEFLEVALNSGPKPDLISDITDGYGAYYKLAYKSISDTTVYVETKSTSNGLAHNTSALLPQLHAPVFKLQDILGGNSTVISDYVLSNDSTINKGGAFNYRYSYKYSDAILDINGRGWLGFHTKTTFDHQTDKESVLTLNQVFPLTGTVASRQSFCTGSSFDSRCKTDVSLSRIDYQYLNCAAPGCTSQQGKQYQPYEKIYQVLLTDKEREYHDYGKYNFTVAEEFEYDRWGNLILKTYLGYVDRDNMDLDTLDNVYTHYSYINDTLTNRLGYEKAVLVSSRKGYRIADVICDSSPIFDNKKDFSLSTKTYDEHMNIESKCLWANDTDPPSWLSFGYNHDEFGNRLIITDPNGATTTYTYETTYNTYENSVHKPRDAQGQRLPTIFYGYDPRFGTQVAKQDYNGNIFIVALDGFGRQVASQGPIPAEPPDVKGDPNLANKNITGIAAFSGVEVVTLATIAYGSHEDSLYQQHKTLQSWTTATSPQVREDQVYIDVLGRNYKNLKLDGCTNGLSVVRLTEYDSENNITRQSIPFYDGEATYWNRTYYDIYNRTIRASEVSGPDGIDSTITTMGYKGYDRGHVLTQILAANSAQDSYKKVVYYELYNGRSVARKMVVPSDSNATTSYDYDQLARPTTATDPIGSTNTVSYNSRGKRWTLNNPAQGKISFVYNKEGQLISKEDFNGTIHYSYDILGRRISRTLPDSTLFRYTYDEESAENGQGKLTSKQKILKNGTIVFNYDYDYSKYKQLTGKKSTIYGAPESYIIRQEYDPLGRMTEFQYPDGEIMTWTYDHCHLTHVSLGNTTYAAYKDYTSLGSPQTIEYENKTSNIFSFSPTGQLTNLEIQGPDDMIFVRDSMALNSLNFVTSIEDQTDQAVDFSQAFTYTDLRLTGASAPDTYGAKSYEYDGGGNLLLKDDIRYTYKGHQVISGKKGDDDYFKASYDGIGNLKQKTVEGVTWKYIYNSLNQLTSAQNVPVGQSTTFEYNGKGQRIIKANSNGSKTFYIHKYYVVTLFADGKTQNTKYIADPAGRIASITKSESAEKAGKGLPQKGKLFFHKNALGSTVLTTKANGSLSSRPVYTPYGRIYSPLKTNDFSIKYTGQELDPGTGLYYYKARFYDPQVGHFTTADDGLGAGKIRQDAFNRYGYVLGAPTVYNDPTGNSALGLTCAIGGGVLTVGGFIASAIGFTSPDTASVHKAGVAGLVIGGVGVASAVGCGIYEVANFARSRAGRGVVDDNSSEADGNRLSEVQEEDEGTGQSDSMGNSTELGEGDNTTTADEGNGADAQSATESASEEGASAAGEGAETAGEAATEAGAEAGTEAGSDVVDIIVDILIDIFAFL